MIGAHMSALAFLLSLFASPAFADAYVTCTYKFAGVEFATLALTIHDDGSPSSSVSITHQGRTHKETATGDVIGPGELAHYWISKQSKQNDLEAIIYRDRQPDGISKMMNHHAPFGDTMWAEDCAGLPN